MITNDRGFTTVSLDASLIDALERVKQKLLANGVGKMRKQTRLMLAERGMSRTSLMRAAIMELEERCK